MVSNAFYGINGLKIGNSDNPTDQVCYGKLVSLENVAIWAMQSLLTEDRIIAAFFIGLYSMLGNHELQIIQRKYRSTVIHGL